jgi:hypothetical protein
VAVQRYCPVTGVHRSPASLASLPQADYAVISPYVRPPNVLRRNIGDGFIFDSAIKLIGARPVAVFTSRAPLSDHDIERINATRCLVAIGANSLKDDFKLTLNFDESLLSQIKVPIALMGVGHVGVADRAKGLHPHSVRIFRALLERFPLASVRCEASRRYVLDSMPDQVDAVLMTSCPVAYDVDNINSGFVRKDVYEQLVVTVTDRERLDAQLPFLAHAKRAFPARRRILALHQDEQNERLWNYAAQEGYEVFRPTDYEPFLVLYAGSDMHFGNRVHAHLKCLSLGVRTFLAPFDLRQLYFSQSLDFPLITDLPASSALLQYDFNRATARRDLARLALEKFIAMLRHVLKMPEDSASSHR